MALYRGVVTSASPLLIQIGTGAATALLTEFSAQGENALGAASRPTLSRPSAPGIGTGTVPQVVNHWAFPPVSTITTTFSDLPSLPSPSSGAFNLPIKVRWVAPPSQAFVVYPSGYALLFAVATGGHLWSGEIGFDER
jgi:hypothetical protein